MSQSASRNPRRSSATAMQTSASVAGRSDTAADWRDTTTTLPPVPDAPAPGGRGPNGAVGASNGGAPASPALAPTPPTSAANGRAPKVPKRTDRAPRRAKLQVRHVNVWSVLKFSCVLALALFLVWMIVVALTYTTLDRMEVFSKINDTVQKIDGAKTEENYVSRNVVFGAALIIGLVNTVLFILLSTIGSIVYNLCADLVGGVEVTLAERD